MNRRPKEQIVLLAGLSNDATRARIWALPALEQSVERLRGAGLIDDGSLSVPAGVHAARSLHHIQLDDLLAEHLPEQV